MSTVVGFGCTLPSPLLEILGAEVIDAGSEPSYQLCKLIYTHHVLGAKIAEFPVRKAQSKPREITIQRGFEDVFKRAFEVQHKAIAVNANVRQCATLARVYGIAAIAILVEGEDPSKPLDLRRLYKKKFSFNVFDPLNISGSTTLNQNPNDMDFLKTSGIIVQGVRYHPSRCCIKLNESPVYLEYTRSGFGYVGRSVYQRALFPLQSYIKVMVADDMIATKVGTLIAKMKQAGSIVDAVTKSMFGIKRNVVKEAQTNNVVSISTEESIESLNLQNMDAPHALARKHIIESIALAVPQPAQLINSESFAEGFGEGTEDAKDVVEYIDTLREEIDGLYAWFDNITQHLAWNPDWYETVQSVHADAKDVPYDQAFYDAVNSFSATWPSLMREPDSEKIKVDEVQQKSTESMFTMLEPVLSPMNKARLVQWVQDNANARKLLFPVQLDLDIEEQEDYAPPEQELAESGEDKEPRPPKAFKDSDSVWTEAAE